MKLAVLSDNCIVYKINSDAICRDHFIDIKVKNSSKCII